MSKYVTTRQAALLEGITERGVRKKIENKKYKDIKPCECENKSWLINIKECKK